MVTFCKQLMRYRFSIIKIRNKVIKLNCDGKQGIIMDRYGRERSPHRERRRDRSPYRERRRERSSHREKKRDSSNVLTYKKLKKMPLNLRKKALREARNRHETIQGKRLKRKRNPQEVPNARRIRNDFDRSEHNAMLASTSQELRRILQDFETLSDIPHDITPTELQGEVR